MEDNLKYKTCLSGVTDCKISDAYSYLSLENYNVVGCKEVNRGDELEGC